MSPVLLRCFPIVGQTLGPSTDTDTESSPLIGAQMLLEASVREGSNAPAVPLHGSTNAGGGVCGGTRSGTQRAHAAHDSAVHGRNGSAATPRSQQKPVQGKKHHAAEQHNHDSSQHQHHQQQSAAGSATELGAFAPKRAADTMLPTSPSKRLCQTMDTSASELSTDASLDLGGPRAAQRCYSLLCFECDLIYHFACVTTHGLNQAAFVSQDVLRCCQYSRAEMVAPPHIFV